MIPVRKFGVEQASSLLFRAKKKTGKMPVLLCQNSGLEKDFQRSADFPVREFNVEQASRLFFKNSGLNPLSDGSSPFATMSTLPAPC